MSPDWLMTRLTVVTVAILGPVYFFLLMLFLPFQMTPFGDPLLDLVFHYLIAPTVFSLTWVGIIFYYRYRLANTVHLSQEATDAVPLRWRIFYGTNAAFVLLFFVLPLVAAPLAIISGLVVAGHVFYRIGVGKLGGGKPAAFIGILVGIALCIVPTLIMFEFIPQYILVWQSIMASWNDFWLQVVYGVAQCFVNALSFGAPIHFIFFGAQEYEKGLYGRTYSDPPTTKIRIFEILLFFVFIFLYLPPIGPIPFLDMAWLFTNFINWASLSIVAIMILVRWRLQVGSDTTLGGFWNILVIGMFLIVEIFFKTNLLIISLIIWLAFILFAAVTVVNFLRASPREMY